MPILDLTYFHDEIHIAQRSQVDVQDSLMYFIDKYEPEILRRLLGKELYQEFIVGLGQPTVAQKWVTLRDWLFNSNLKTSPVANYVYVKYQENTETKSVGIGNGQSLSENVRVVTPVRNMTRAWNEMCNQFQEVHEHIRENIEDYPNYRFRHIHRIAHYQDPHYSCGHNLYLTWCKCHGRKFFIYRNSFGV